MVSRPIQGFNAIGPNLMSTRPLRVLLVEDQPMEADLLVRGLKKAGFDLDWRRVETEEDYLDALSPSLDVVLADYSLPSFGAPRALALLKASGLDVPFIVVSGSITEETAVEVLRNGAADYLLKDRLVRLPTAVERAIEERKRERERAALQDQYRQAQKMEAVGQLAGGVAHDFNNILTAIGGYCELVVEQLPADHPVQADLNEIQQAAQRAGSLTRQLLAFGRKQVIEPKIIDLRESLTSIVPMLKRLIGEDIVVIVRAGAAAGRVKADPGQIEQVLLNLAVNARDAMPGGGTLTLEVADAELDDGRYVMLAATDTGVGMDRETQARIFEPFFTTKEKGKGTGLGLSTVYGIVQQSGGHILLFSEPGAGTTFKVYLPRVDEPLEDRRFADATASRGGSETILVVEDEPSVRDLVRRVLEQIGYEVITANAPGEAIELAAKVSRAIHLLVSDVILPEMSGSALVALIVHTHPEMRVLYISGYTDDAVLKHDVLERGLPFLQKPFTSDALARKVREVLA
jgi:two-component system cell cycle sensor histidine kinase/response regulator CckA